MSFHGSYAKDDVTFLLKPVDMAPTPVAEKERLIQSGQRHYSEILAPESPPSPTYLAHYAATLAQNGPRLGQDIARLALTLAKKPVTLVSLARAGTPIGVLLHRTLQHLGQTSTHYSISIIRGRGIDTVALDHIVAHHPADSVVFVDGWTGKGAIRGQLDTALDAYAKSTGVRLDPGLVVISDLAGVAGLAASADDYVIPSAILNAVVSGLVSRTVLNDAHVHPGDFHACVYYTQWADHDVSTALIEAVMPHVHAALDAHCTPATWTDIDRQNRITACAIFMNTVMEHFGIGDRNRIKPGAGEATRAVLRRVPERILFRDLDDPGLAHLRWLATDKKVSIEVWPKMPYRAATLIQRVGPNRLLKRSNRALVKRD